MKPPSGGAVSAGWLQPLAGKADYLGLRGRLFAVAHSPNLTDVVGKPLMDKMERFTQRARNVMSLAQEETERLQRGTLDTQHLLFGILVEEGGVAGRVLREMGIQITSVREKIEQMAPTNTYHSDTPPTLSEGTKRVLEFTVDEARRMGNHYAGTEHLLLGLARLNEGGAIEILKGMNVTPEQIRHTTRRVLRGASLRSKSSETETPSPPLSLRHHIMYVTVRDAESKEEKVVFSIKLERAWVELANISHMVFQGKEVTPLQLHSGDNQIEVTVEKAKD